MWRVNRAREFESFGQVNRPPALVLRGCVHVKKFLWTFQFMKLFYIKIFDAKISWCTVLLIQNVQPYYTSYMYTMCMWWKQLPLLHNYVTAFGCRGTTHSYRANSSQLQISNCISTKNSPMDVFDFAYLVQWVTSWPQVMVLNGRGMLPYLLSVLVQMSANWWEQGLAQRLFLSCCFPPPVRLGWTN